MEALIIHQMEQLQEEVVLELHNQELVIQELQIQVVVEVVITMQHHQQVELEVQEL